MIAVFLHHLFARSFHHVYRYVLGKTYESGERVEGQEQAPVARNEPGLQGRACGSPVVSALLHF
jgi:hypothetical protein